MGQESPERKFRQAAGKKGTDRCKVQRQKAGQVTRAETRRRGHGQKADQIPGNSSGKECWRVVHDAITVRQRASVEELVKKEARGSR